MHLRWLSFVGARSAVRLSVSLLVLSLGSCGGTGSPTAVSATPQPSDAMQASRPPDWPEAAKSLAGKTIVGYQAWFGCPAEPGVSGNAARWRHWFDAQVDDAAHLTVDMLPDVAELPATALCTTRIRHKNGSPLAVFSSASPAVIDLHFRWMKTHGIDGAAIQRFVGPLRDRADRDRSDIILRAIATAAEVHGRVIYISYDISGADPASVYDDIRADWRHVTDTLNITTSRAYLSAQGRPLLQLWGFGFKDRPGEPEQVLRLMADLRGGLGAAPESSGAVQLPAVVLIGGVPAGWREGRGDAKTGAEWSRAYRSYDVISPWAVGRYDNEATNRGFVEDLVVGDLAEADRLALGYMPVIFPGFSWANLMRARGDTAAAIRNRIPRRCGDFLWTQGQTRLAAGARSLFIAMFDEVDEATAIMPVVSRTADLPPDTGLVALDEDGCDLPSDWYLRISGSLAGYLRSTQVPPVSLSAVLRP